MRVRVCECVGLKHCAHEANVLSGLLCFRPPTQFLIQFEGTKHITLVPGMAGGGSAALSRLAWERGGILNMTDIARDMLKEGIHPEDEMPAGVQTCLLKPGEVLWMPPRMPHDVFALGSSISLNMRFNTLE